MITDQRKEALIHAVADAFEALGIADVPMKEQAELLIALQTACAAKLYKLDKAVALTMAETVLTQVETAIAKGQS